MINGMEEPGEKGEHARITITTDRLDPFTDEAVTASTRSSFQDDQTERSINTNPPTITGNPTTHPQQPHLISSFRFGSRQVGADGGRRVRFSDPQDTQLLSTLSTPLEEQIRTSMSPMTGGIRTPCSYRSESTLYDSDSPSPSTEKSEQDSFPFPQWKCSVTPPPSAHLVSGMSSPNTSANHGHSSSAGSMDHSEASFRHALELEAGLCRVASSAPATHEGSTAESEALDLVMHHTSSTPNHGTGHERISQPSWTPEREDNEHNALRPSPGVLSHLLQLYQQNQEHRNRSRSSSAVNSPLSSGYSTPVTNVSSVSLNYISKKRETRQKWKSERNQKREEISKHITHIIQKKALIVNLCQSLMSFGAPTHRLEEIVRATADALRIEGQFLYLPSYMLCSFDDSTTHTSETRIIRQAVTEINLAKIDRTYTLFKNIVNNDMYCEDATKDLETIISDKPLYPIWVLIILYGVATAAIGPVAFEAGLKDLPILWILGVLLGIMQLIIVPKYDAFGCIFEPCAAILTTIIARAMGSIAGGKHFCFSALAQSSIALILPGYMILVSALELQTRNMITGSVRLVYAIIYSLFLGFGITVGSIIYGLVDKNATSATTCLFNQIPDWANFIAVPIFVFCLMLINQASMKQTPVGVFIGAAGYAAQYFASSAMASSSPQFSSFFGALVLGILGNLYSRFTGGLGFSVMLPGIFVQVPGGLAARGSIISGVRVADEIVHQNKTIAGLSSGYGVQGDEVLLEMHSWKMGFGMVQIVVGLTLGFFVAMMMVYPKGVKGRNKKGSLMGF